VWSGADQHVLRRLLQSSGGGCQQPVRHTSSPYYPDKRHSTRTVQSWYKPHDVDLQDAKHSCTCSVGLTCWHGTADAATVYNRSVCHVAGALQTPAGSWLRARCGPAGVIASSERHADGFARQLCADKYRCYRVGQRRVKEVSPDNSSPKRNYADRQQEADPTSVWPKPGPRGLNDTVLMKHGRIPVTLFVVSGFTPQQGSHLHSVLRT